MPNNSSLPKPSVPTPNHPKAGANKTDQQAAANKGSAVQQKSKAAQKPQTPQTPQPKQQPGQQPPQQSSQIKQSASQQPQSGKPQTNQVQTNPATNKSSATVSSPAGLDPQAPGGPMPKLTEKGQVTSTSTISQTPQAKDFSKQSELPVSKIQQVQKRVDNGQFQSGKDKKPSAIRPEQAKNKQAVGVGAQQSIGAAPQGGGGKKRAATVTHPNLGSNIPSVSSPGKKDKKGLLKGKPGQDKETIKNKNKKSAQKKAKQTKAADTANSSKNKFAAVKKPIFKYVLFGVLALLIVGGVAFGITQILGGDADLNGDEASEIISDTGPDLNTDPSLIEDGGVPSAGEAELTYWGLWEPDQVIQEILNDFEKETGIKVDYRQQSHKDYRTHLQSAIADGGGPDVFRYHASWVPMLKDELAPLPNRIMSLAEYEQTFFQIAVDQLQHNGQLVGIPLMYDGLGLFYNQDILQTANEQPPQTWAELRSLANKLTVRSGDTIERGGLAIGNADNVEHFSDILGLLIMQNGGDPSQPMSSEVKDAIDFYVSFSQGNSVFSTNLPSSTTAFARGEVAMMLAPSWRVHEVRHMNSELNFAIAPAPKLTENDYAWASYWAEGVNSNSDYQDEAWQLLKYLSSKEGLKKLYSEQGQIRAFGEIYPRLDMASELINDDYVGAFLQDAPFAASWYLCSYTHDDGINDRIIDYYRDAVNAAARGRISESDLETLDQGVSQVLRQYGL